MTKRCVIVLIHAAATRKRLENMNTVFQSSDLANKRKEVIAAARDGRVTIRDGRNEPLIMLPEREIENLDLYRKWTETQRRLRSLLDSGRDITIAELGELAWLRTFDREDIKEFCEELDDYIIACFADGDFSALDACIKDWRITASQLEDPLRRRVLLAQGIHSEEFEDVSRPEGQ